MWSYFKKKCVSDEFKNGILKLEDVKFTDAASINNCYSKLEKVSTLLNADIKRTKAKGNYQKLGSAINNRLNSFKKIKNPNLADSQEILAKGAELKKIIFDIETECKCYIISESRHQKESNFHSEDYKKYPDENLNSMKISLFHRTSSDRVNSTKFLFNICKTMCVKMERFLDNLTEEQKKNEKLQNAENLNWEIIKQKQIINMKIQTKQAENNTPKPPSSTKQEENNTHKPSSSTKQEENNTHKPPSSTKQEENNTHKSSSSTKQEENNTHKSSSNNENSNSDNTNLNNIADDMKKLLSMGKHVVDQLDNDKKFNAQHVSDALLSICEISYLKNEGLQTNILALKSPLSNSIENIYENVENIVTQIKNRLKNDTNDKFEIIDLLEQIAKYNTHFKSIAEKELAAFKVLTTDVTNRIREIEKCEPITSREDLITYIKKTREIISIINKNIIEPYGENYIQNQYNHVISKLDSFKSSNIEDLNLANALTNLFESNDLTSIYKCKLVYIIVSDMSANCTNYPNFNKNSESFSNIYSQWLNKQKGIFRQGAQYIYQSTLR